MGSLPCVYVRVYDQGMVKQPMVARQVRVPKAEWDEAKANADQNDETISDVVRRAIISYNKENKS
jgi:uncharacterized protein YqiB (DUF1249 family)